MNRLMDTRRIQENNLSFGSRHDPAHYVSRGLGFIGDDGDLLADQAIQESGFSGVRPSDDRNEPGLSHVLSVRESSTSSVGRAGGRPQELRFRLRRVRSFLLERAIFRT